MTQSFEFDAEIQVLRPALVRFVGRLTGDAAAEDVVQVALTKAARNLSKFRGDAPLRAWIFRIARNVALDHLRTRKNGEGEFSDETHIPILEDGVTPTQERRIERREMSRCIDDVLRSLPLRYQEVLALSDMEELSDKDAAAILGITAGAAKIRLHRARAQLKSELEKACSFYRDTDNVLCCDKKQNFKKSAYPSEPEPRPQGKGRQMSGDAESKKEDIIMNNDSGLSAKQKHLIGVGAAIAAGCRPCTLSFAAGAKAEGACNRGLGLTIERGLESRARSTNDMTSFTDTMFERPEIDDVFREGRASLDTLIAVAAAVASNTASAIESTVTSARNVGATEAQIHMAAQIGKTARRGAENEIEKCLTNVLGKVSSSPCCEPPKTETAEGGKADNATPCGCGCTAENEPAS